jgi:D-amino peptidase
VKVYISADIEGVTDVTHWDETELGKGVFAQAQEQMIAEVVAACEGARDAGATEIWVKDAHDTGCNLIHGRLPREVKLIRAWAPHPLMMMQELDETFAAVALIGYHSRAASGGSPLSHTMTGEWALVTINGQPASECLINTMSAAMFRVPVVLVTGDKALCEEVNAFNPATKTIAVKEGRGNSTINIHPHTAVELIKKSMKEALTGDLKACLKPLPDYFDVKLTFRKHAKAFSASFYPGAEKIDDCTVGFKSDRYYEVLRFLQFV